MEQIFVKKSHNDKKIKSNECVYYFVVDAVRNWKLEVKRNE